MAEPISYFNGDFVPDSECRIHISDRAFRRGDTIYDVSRTFGGRVHRLGEHIDRLYRSLKYARIDPGMSQEDMEEVTHEVIRTEPAPRRRRLHGLAYFGTWLRSIPCPNQYPCPRNALHPSEAD